MNTLQIIEHAVAQEALTEIRDKHSDSAAFRTALERTTFLLMAEATRHLPVRTRTVESPLATTTGVAFAGSAVLVPILRAGLGMLSPARMILPQARVGFIGLERDERTAVAHPYYHKLPTIREQDTVFMLDPMLATGGSMADAVSTVKKAGAAKIVAVCIIAAPEGAARMGAAHPDVPIFVAALDEKLSPASYILPGLGDAGDRFCGMP